jgi:hypothetical protein
VGKGLIGGNAVNPGVELRGFSEAIQIFIHLDKNLLQDIVSIFMVNYHFPDMPVHALLILLYQGTERTAFAVITLKLKKYIPIFQILAGFEGLDDLLPLRFN